MWLIFTALLVASINPQSHTSVTFASTCWVKGQPDEEIVLRCGDGEHEGEVQFWHTPFGDLQSSGSQSKLDPVFMHQDGSLIIPNSSIHHGGLYYCILRHAEGTTLWPFELHVDQNMGAEAEEGGGGGGDCAACRFRRNAAFPGEKEAIISDEIFAGAVAASVLLTFVVGFSAGALSRTPVLRCFKSLCPKQRRRQADEPDGSRVIMTSLPPANHDQAFRTGATPHDSRFWRTAATPTALETPSPPAKPKRSFRVKVEEKEEEEPERTAYLEGCDSNMAEEETGSGEDGEAKEEEEESVKQDEEDGESETEDREDREEEEVVREEEKQETDESEELEQESTGTDEERSDKAEAEAEPGGGDPPPGSARRRSRVIRLYQYDEDGQRYGHLPEPEAPEAAPRPRQRSRSLTRLNAIMAAAAAGPMEPEEERQHFRMDI
ncbi:uncharacterized protein LOC129359316 [Poeciliopsis prolifica]|uniref:uncharacterized protein LOC129359316 n=1 Tax=Poeciliopsis prolifica TaxID=188132 RepID=UPI002412F173|nr:uncharacterized protein LOC129359316 [Poeciliopsis prolifica]XP_054884834.1 uncharacterized protein LOC129359316 [Poeciliopsis prolifica]XP_054884836.1 uncharacterized protein LOC129359316 [Poeciliopsis prolifica]